MGIQVSKAAGDTSSKAITVKDIASKMAGAGKAKEALKAAGTIETPYKAQVIKEIGLDLIKSGLDTTSKNKIIKEAVKTAQSVEDTKEIAKRQELLRQLLLKPLQTIYPLPVIQGK